MCSLLLVTNENRFPLLQYIISLPIGIIYTNRYEVNKSRTFIADNELVCNLAPEQIVHQYVYLYVKIKFSLFSKYIYCDWVKLQQII